jgi:hypothetical protein
MWEGGCHIFQGGLVDTFIQSWSSDSIVGVGGRRHVYHAEGGLVLRPAGFFLELGFDFGFDEVLLEMVHLMDVH